ncbi:hypothetical protein [Streptomyces sp. NPDC086766]|uniref:hypothetical protein n=1 Tax=Streptomyces sp. NPDC086766 TaxID=3365754 RepID=UPI0037F375D4
MSGQVEDTQESAMVVGGACSLIFPESFGTGAGPATPASQAPYAAERGDVTIGAGNQLGAEQGAVAGHTDDRLGVPVLAEPGLDMRTISWSSFRDRSGQRACHGRGRLLAGDLCVLQVPGFDRSGRDGAARPPPSSLATVATITTVAAQARVATTRSPAGVSPKTAVERRAASGVNGGWST